jgi:uncharacterized protein YebE (UPF0316 family)
VFTQLLIIFTLYTITTFLGNLKSVFLRQQAIKSVYLTTFIDAVIFTYAFKLITGSKGYGFVLAFALGRIFGVFLADKLEKKLAIGLLEVNVYKHPEQGKILADKLRCTGYSVTTTIGYGFEGKNRLILTIILPRKQFSELKEIVEQDGTANMSVKTINKIYGKVGSQTMIAGNN